MCRDHLSQTHVCAFVISIAHISSAHPRRAAALGLLWVRVAMSRPYCLSLPFPLCHCMVCKQFYASQCGYKLCKKLQTSQYIYIYIYIYICKGHNQTRSAHRGLMHSQKSLACLMLSLMRSYAELPPACGPNGVQNHAGKKPEFRQCLVLSVMRDLRLMRPFKNRASELTSYVPLTPHRTFVE